MDKSNLKLPSYSRKFHIGDEYREKIKKDSGPITKENLLAIMSVHTEKMAQYIVDYEKLVKEYKASKRHYAVVYDAVYQFYRYDPSVEIVFYDPKRDRNDALLVQAVESDPDVQAAQKLQDELEAECSMMTEFLKAFNQRSWTCKNILDLLKFEHGEIGG